MEKFKYPKTLHLPWSQGVSADDKVISYGSLSCFFDKEIIVTEKMDGENTTFSREYIHARSLDTRPHPSRDWVKSFWGNLKHEIPEGWRICGENVLAKHSIQYDNLSSYFLGFSIWNEKNIALDWNSTLEWFNLLGITPVEEMYRGFFDIKKLENLSKNLDSSSIEGYVIRVVSEFNYDDFKNNVAKYVRKNHVQTSDHWLEQEIIQNKLKIS